MTNGNKPFPPVPNANLIIKDVAEFVKEVPVSGVWVEQREKVLDALNLLHTMFTVPSDHSTHCPGPVPEEWYANPCPLDQPDENSPFRSG
jgi:hypothetical protein